MQAKDIDADEFIELIAAIQRRKGMWANTWDIEAARPGWPRKVFLAKAQKLINQGRLDGCACGCRGDFEAIQLTAAEIAASGRPSTLDMLRKLTEGSC